MSNRTSVAVGVGMALAVAVSATALYLHNPGHPAHRTFGRGLVAEAGPPLLLQAPAFTPSH